MSLKSQFDHSRTCITESLSQLYSLEGQAVDLEGDEFLLEFWKQACNARAEVENQRLGRLGKAFTFQACTLCLKLKIKTSFSSPLKLEEICPSVPPSTMK